MVPDKSDLAGIGMHNELCLMEYIVHFIHLFKNNKTKLSYNTVSQLELNHKRRPSFRGGREAVGPMYSRPECIDGVTCMFINKPHARIE